MDIQERLEEAIGTVSKQKQQLQEQQLQIEGQLQNLCNTEEVLQEAQKTIIDNEAKIVELEEKVQQLKEHSDEAAEIMQALQQWLPAVESATTLTKDNAAVEKPERSPSPAQKVMEPESPVASQEPTPIKVETGSDDAEIKHGVDWERSKQAWQNNGASRVYWCHCKSFFAWTYEDMKRHIRMKTAQEFFACPAVGCEQKFCTTQKLRDHALREHKINYKKSGCGRCGMLFDKLDDLRMHKIQNHPEWRRGRKRVYEVTEDGPANDHDAAGASAPHGVPKVKRGLPG